MKVRVRKANSTHANCCCSNPISYPTKVSLCGRCAHAPFNTTTILLGEALCPHRRKGGCKAKIPHAPWDTRVIWTIRNSDFEMRTSSLASLFQSIHHIRVFRSLQSFSPSLFNLSLVCSSLSPPATAHLSSLYLSPLSLAPLSLLLYHLSLPLSAPPPLLSSLSLLSLSLSPRHRSSRSLISLSLLSLSVPSLSHTH